MTCETRASADPRRVQESWGQIWRLVGLDGGGCGSEILQHFYGRARSPVESRVSAHN